MAMDFHLRAVRIIINMTVLSAAVLISSCSGAAATPKYPLILIPGSGGNQLEARLTPAYKPSSLWCNFPLKRKGPDGWFRLWFDPTVIFEPFTKCFNQRMMIYYDPAVDDYHNAPGVETRAPLFGSTQSLLYLNPNLKHITSYMEPLVRSLEEMGYVSGENLFGAPYDFRYGLAAEGHPCRVGSKFLSDLKDLVESASASNGGRPVILLSHSLGGLFALQLLNRQPCMWREKYVKHLITLSAPWGGTVQEMLTFASGNAFGVPLVNPLLVRPEQRSCTSNLWLMPSPSVFEQTKPLVITPSASYSSSDIARFLQDIGFPEGVDPYNTRILPLVESLPEPRVPVTCIVGSSVETPETLVYGDSGFDKRPKVVYGDGDGTVNTVSLLAVESAWGGESNQSLKVIKLPGVSHTSVLKDKTALTQIIADVTSINSEISMACLVRSS